MISTQIPPEIDGAELFGLFEQIVGQFVVQRRRLANPNRRSEVFRRIAKLVCSRLEKMGVNTNETDAASVVAWYYEVADQSLPHSISPGISPSAQLWCEFLHKLEKRFVEDIKAGHPLRWYPGEESKFIAIFVERESRPGAWEIQ